MYVCAQLWYLRLENHSAVATFKKKKRDSTQGKSDFAIDLQFCKRKYRSGAQTYISVSFTF